MKNSGEKIASGERLGPNCSIAIFFKNLQGFPAFMEKRIFDFKTLLKTFLKAI